VTDQLSVEERVARYMAAEDWPPDPGDFDDWWNNRSTEFRDDYFASARRVIAIVYGADPRPANTTGESA
jgi:uncharacterized protein (DUF2236 family)